ncbi:MAG: hypothetical protein LC777_06845 [Actinobacteria bacterium]|nr:hypothetical protein [Actinomycetota bacterium]
MSFVATVTGEGSHWLAEVQGLPGAHAYARTLTRLREELTNAIILSADLPDDAKPEISFILDSGVDQAETLRLAFALAQERHKLHALEAILHEQVAAVVTELVGGGYSVRDVAGALDVTPGRVSQLANANTKRAKNSRAKTNKSKTATAP